MYRENDAHRMLFRRNNKGQPCYWFGDIDEFTNTLTIHHGIVNKTDIVEVIHTKRPVKDEYEKIEQALNEIPQDATVTASHSIVPHLYFVDQLYTIPEYYGNNKEIDETDYYIVDTSLAENAQEMQNAMPADCKLIKRVSFIEIYKHN